MFLSLCISVFLIFTAPLRSPRPAPSPSELTKAEQHISTDKSKSKTEDQAVPKLAVTAINQETTEPKAKHPQSADDKSSDRSASNYWDLHTILITIFTGVLALVAWLQFRTMRRQAEFMRQSMEETRKSADAATINAKAFINSERAWIDARIESIEIGEHNTGPGHTKIVLENRGKIPAIVTALVVAPRMIDSTRKPVFDLTDGKPHPHMMGVMVAPGIPERTYYDVPGELISKSDTLLSVEIRYKDAHHPNLHSRLLYLCKQRKMSARMYVERLTYSSDKAYT